MPNDLDSTAILFLVRHLFETVEIGIRNQMMELQVRPIFRVL